MKTCINKNLRSANEMCLSQYHFFSPLPLKGHGLSEQSFSYGHILWHSSEMLGYKGIFLNSKISSCIIIICFLISQVEAIFNFYSFTWGKN